MADHGSVRRQINETSNHPTARNLSSRDGIFDALAATNIAPANDNPEINELPACLPVTDAEVSLLHQYLGQEILGLFS